MSEHPERPNFKLKSVLSRALRYRPMGLPSLDVEFLYTKLEYYHCTSAQPIDI